MSHTNPIKPISNRVRKQYRVFSRRKLAELRSFYRSVMKTPQTAIAVRMNAAERLQELFQMELEERQLLDVQERDQAAAKDAQAAEEKPQGTAGSLSPSEVQDGQEEAVVLHETPEQFLARMAQLKEDINAKQ